MLIHFRVPSRKPLTVFAMAILFTSSFVYAGKEKSFNRISTFPVFLNSSIENETVAEIVTASKNGKTLIYTDGKLQSLGFVDIRNPNKPKPSGLVMLEGEPTSVAVKSRYALAAVNTSENFINVSGQLVVINIKSKKIVRTIELGGQPDSIAVSPDGKYAAIVIENERNEEWCVVPGSGLENDFPVIKKSAEKACEAIAGASVGGMPQQSAGYLVVVNLRGRPNKWTTSVVELNGLDGMLYPSDPEPEFVDINKRNIAAITLQENNHIVLVDLRTKRIVNHFSAGFQDLENIDLEKDKLITLDSRLIDIPREPDGVSWINNSLLVTADEGDLSGGSRGYTIYDTFGGIEYEAGNSVEHTIVRHGHYPEKRSAKKGNEPENVEVAKFKRNKFLFVGSERASVVLVYDISNPTNPKLKQLLPTAVKPEGLLAIPQRGLLITAGEKDDRGNKIRSALTIYRYNTKERQYPTVISSNRSDNTPIPWGALSGLAADPDNKHIMYSIHDSFYDQARIFQLDISDKPAVLHKEIILLDSQGVLAAVFPGQVNENKTVKLDQEGISIRKAGGFWIASEGKGTVGKKTVKSKNIILGVSSEGEIEQVIQLPENTNALQVKYGFEGISSTGTVENEVLYIIFQREWASDPAGLFTNRSLSSGK